MVRKRTRGLPKELSRVNLNAAGIDVGASSHFVAVSEASAEECVREFEAYTSELYRMAELACRVRGEDGGDGVDGSVLRYLCSGCWRSGDLRCCLWTRDV